MKLADSVSRLLSRVANSPNILSGGVFGVSGLAFAAANLILADVQDVEDYAIFSLVIAVLTLASGIGVFGADGNVNRNTFALDRRMFARVLSTGAVAAGLGAVLLVAGYDVDRRIAALLLIAVLAQTVIYFVAAYFQSRHDFALSLISFNSSNYVLLGVALLAKLANVQDTLHLVTITTIALIIIAGFYSAKALRMYASVDSEAPYSWREAFAYISIAGSAFVLVQLERLLAPKLLDLTDLATLGVVLALVGPPFRLLQVSLGYVLLPKLRKARGSGRAKAMIRREIGMALVLLVPSWILVWYFVPILETWFFGDKYVLSKALIFSVIFAGTAKALSGIARASVAALVSSRDLELMGIAGWIGVLLSMGCAWYAASFGLAGIVYSVSIGWILRLIVAVVLVRRYLRASEEPQAATVS